MNLPECLSQFFFSNVLKSPLFFSYRIRVVSKKSSLPKFSARVISHVPKYFQICPNLFQEEVPVTPSPPSPTPMLITII